MCDDQLNEIRRLRQVCKNKEFNALFAANHKSEYWPTKQDAFNTRYDISKFGEGFDYDTAVPQSILNAIKEETGQYCYMFVYGYGKDLNQGLIPLTNEAEILLKVYIHILNQFGLTFKFSDFAYTDDFAEYWRD